MKKAGIFARARLGIARALTKGITGSDQFDWVTEHPSWRVITGGSQANVTQPYRQSPWVYSGSRAKARLLASMPFVIKRGPRDGVSQGMKVPATDPLAVLFDRPSPMMTGSEFFEAISIYLDLYGEWFGVKLGRDGKPAPRNVVPSELILVHPRLMMHNVNTTTHLIRSWTLGDEKRALGEIPVESVVHHRLFNPDNPYRGLSPLDAARQGIAIEYRADAYTDALLKNDATPNGVLSVPEGVDDKLAEELQKRWEDRQGGARNRGRVAVLTEGMTWQSIAQTSKEMQIGDQRNVDREQIQAVLGVTPHEMGKLGDMNRAGAQTYKEWLWDTSVIPLKRSVEETLYVQLFRHLAGGVWGEFDTRRVEALLPKLSDKLDIATKLVDLGYDLNVVNDHLDLGMPRVEVVAIGTPGASATQGASYGTVTVGDTSGSAGAVHTSGGVVVGASEPISQGGAVTIGRAADAARTGKGAPFRIVAHGSGAAPTGVRRKAIPKRRGARLIRAWERRASATVGRALASFYREMRDNAVRAAGIKRDVATANLSPTQVDALLGAPQRWREAARKHLADLMDTLARGAVKNAQAILGGTFDVIDIEDPRWIVAAAQRTGQLIRVAVRWREAIRDRIIARIASAEGFSVVQLGDAIQEEFGTVIASNGLTIARTETGMLGSQIRNDIFHAEGITETEWSASGDAHTRDSHRAVDGERRAMGERFSNGLLHPNEPGGPPEEVINCSLDPTTPVTTIDGEKPIGEVAVGDLVLTHNGRYRRVVRVRPEARYSGAIVALRTSEGEVCVTASHPFRTGPYWNRADALKLGDAVNVLLRATDIEEAKLLKYRLAKGGQFSEAIAVPCVPLVEAREERDQLGAALLHTHVWHKQHRSESRGSGDGLVSVDRHPVRTPTHAGLGVLVNEPESERIADPFQQWQMTVGDDDAKVGLIATTFSNGTAPVGVGQAGNVGKLRGCKHTWIITSSVTVDQIQRFEIRDARVYNFAVEEDESYVLGGLVSHNCRCAALPIVT